MRGVTIAIMCLVSGNKYFTPHAGSDPGARIRGQPGRISTRTPHAGSDRNIMRKFTASINI